MEATVERALALDRTRGLVWHTQGSGKTFTMIKAAEMLFKAPEADKPTVLLIIDRNELEDQMLKNLAEVEGVADIEELNKILERAVNLKNFLKGRERIVQVAEFVASPFFQKLCPYIEETVVSAPFVQARSHGTSPTSFNPLDILSLYCGLQPGAALGELGRLTGRRFLASATFLVISTGHWEQG